MEEPKENEGRVPWTELSARDLSCSDQLKPWSAETPLGFTLLRLPLEAGVLCEEALVGAEG